MSSKVANIDKQNFRQELGSKIELLDEQTDALRQLLGSLKLTQRADVTFTAMDDVNAVLKHVGTLRANVENVKRLLKARANTRLRER